MNKINGYNEIWNSDTQKVVYDDYKTVENRFVNINTEFSKYSAFLRNVLDKHDTEEQTQTAFIDKKDFQNHFDFLFQQFIVETSNGILSITPISRPLEISNDDAFILEPAKYLSKQLDLHAKKSYQNLFISFCLLSFTLCIVYRKKAFNYLFPSLLACVGTLSILSLLGQAITFFHLLSLFIVIGLSMDYTIFLFNKNSEYKPVLFSFFSSFIGFGLLSFVHFHMVAIIGQTIALGLLLSFFITLLIKKE